MGGVEDSHWVDMIIDEIGAALSKVDESIQKSIEVWTELTKDIFDDQPTQDLTGQTNNGESGEEHSSQEPPVQVEERPLQHWSMPIDEVKQKPSEHWAMRASKIPECLIQEQGDGDGDSDSDSDDEDDDEEATSSEEDSGSSLKWNVDTSSEKNDESWDDDDDDDEEDETIVTESSENTWEQNLEAWGTSYSEEDNDSSLKWKGYRRLNNVVISSEEDNESCDDDEEEEDETTVSESSGSMLELNLEDSATSYIPSSYHHHNEEDNGSSLKWNVGYQLLKNVDKSSEEDDEDEVEECYLESVEQVLEVLRKHRMSDLSNESFVCLDDEDDVSDEGLFPECDWVYVTRD
ncbi:hypothetical protein V5N11_029534 [Cardamine amara subsp. amara]|uniref:Uncharacterized protein n=1 Tax=Cardamine amara subsp. amara TaxID=228776 RepID=A0ABD1BQ06_CARAN